MILSEYLSDVAIDMQAKSASIRRDFASHRPSAGENREDLVNKFLVDHLPRKFGVSSGVVISHEGVFQSKPILSSLMSRTMRRYMLLLLTSFGPLKRSTHFIEVKTMLHLSELADAIAKGRKFKALKRRFCDAGQSQRIADSLFVIWAFDSAASSTIKANLVAAFAGVPRSEQPDLIVVPDRFVARAESYLEIPRLRQAGSRLTDPIAYLAPDQVFDRVV